MKKKLLYLLILSVLCVSLLPACKKEESDAPEPEPATEEAKDTAEEAEEPEAEEEELNTLEEYMAAHPDAFPELTSQLGPNEYHTDMYIEGNNIYTINEQSAQYKADGMSLEDVMSRQEQTAEALRQSLENSTVRDGCKMYKEKAGTKEIVWTYVFLYGDTEIASIPISSEDE